MPVAEPEIPIQQSEDTDRMDWRASLPFFAMHAVCLFAFWTGVTWWAAGACALLYIVRMFGITAGYHRYFSHASFKTSRPFQFCLAFLGASAAQKGPLWWASHHRHHHAHSDNPEDVHSPVQRGFWYSHVGWILGNKFHETNERLIAGLLKYPELRWLNRNHLMPPVILALAVTAFGYWMQRVHPETGATAGQMLIWGFFIGTVLGYHGTFTVNSLAHVSGSRRFPTKDDSRNNLFIALIALGEGWHNNHHYAPSSERQGFFWWEIDVTHYALAALSWFGIVWDLQGPPKKIHER